MDSSINYRSAMSTLNIGMIIYGSNGDIELMVSLALGLVKSGHKVKLFIVSINKRDYTFLKEVSGIEITQLPFPEESLTRADIEFWSQSPQEVGALMERRYQLIVDKIVDAAYEYGRSCDALVSTTYMLEVPCVAEKFNKPFISLRPFAGHVRSAYEPPFFLPTESFPGLSNLEYWDLYDAYLNKNNKRRINKFRREHGLDPINSVSRELVESPWLNLIAYSNYLYPAKSDWPETHHQCGFFKSPSYIEWDIPKSLADFIADDEPPVFITVGTMMEYEIDRIGFRSRLLSLAHSINRKVIIHADWSEEAVIQNVYLLRGFISYEKIIPLCSLAVHHGGVGTTHIMTELGCPSVVINYGFEHPFNCSVLESQGISGGNILRKDFCERKLKTLIDNALTNTMLSERTSQFSKHLKAEDGVVKAVNLIEKEFGLHVASSNMECTI